MAFPNTITTPAAIFNQVSALLIARVTGLHAGNCAINAAVTWLGNAYPGDLYVQVVPGAAMDISADHAVGRVKHSFTVAVFWRLYNDQSGQDTLRLADSTRGLLQFIVGVNNAIINSALNSLANVPVKPDRTEQAEHDPVDIADGWVMVRRVFTVTYLYNFPATQDIS